MKTEKQKHKITIAGISLAFTAALAVVTSGCHGGWAFAPVTTFTDQMGVINTNVADIKVAQTKLETNYGNLFYKFNEAEQQAANEIDIARTHNLQNFPTNQFTGLIDDELSIATRNLPGASPATKATAVQRSTLLQSTNQADHATLSALLQTALTNAAALGAQKEQLAKIIETNKAELNDKTLALSTNTGKLQQLTLAAKATNELVLLQNKAIIEKNHATTMDRVMFIFLLLGGLILVGTGVACYLHVPGVLVPGGIAGGILLGLGFAIRVVSQLMDHTWFIVVIGAVMVGIGCLLVWFVYRSFHTRQEHALNSQGLDNTVAAIEEMKLRDEENNTHYYEHLRPFLEKWHRTKEGAPDYRLNEHIHKAVKKQHHLHRGKYRAVTTAERGKASHLPDAEKMAADAAKAAVEKVAGQKVTGT